MKRFVLGTNRTTPEQDTAFYNLLRSRWPHLGWWHNISETWLLVDWNGKLTVAEIRDAATEAFPGIFLVVVEAAGGEEWAGFGLAKDFEWFKDAWETQN